MAIKARGKQDPFLNQFVAVLEKYVADHPRAEIELYRRNPASIRVRVIDPDFKGMSETKRDDRIWGYLKQLPEDVLWHLSLLLPFTPEEAAKSPVSHDFDHPLPSRV